MRRYPLPNPAGRGREIPNQRQGGAWAQASRTDAYRESRAGVAAQDVSAGFFPRVWRRGPQTAEQNYNSQHRSCPDFRKLNPGGEEAEAAETQPRSRLFL